MSFRRCHRSLYMTRSRTLALSNVTNLRLAGRHRQFVLCVFEGDPDGLESCLTLSEFIELFPIIDACAPPTIFELTQLIDEEPTRLSSVKQAPLK